METPAESTPKADTNTRKLRPEVERFLERVVVPALVNRYIKELKEGKNPLTTGSVAGPKASLTDHENFHPERSRGGAMSEEILDLLDTNLIRLRVDDREVRGNYRGYVEQLLILKPQAGSSVTKAIQEANSLEELDSKLLPHFDV